jgi:NADH:ubiquinone oxidoreductase subunit K
MDFLLNIGLYHFLILSLFLLLIGFLGAIISKNLLRILISLEIMFCGITLNIGAFSVYTDITHFKGIIFIFFIMILMTIHIVIGIAITMNIFKLKGTTNIEEIGELKG